MLLNSVFRVIIVILVAVVVMLAVYHYTINSIVQEDKIVTVPSLVGQDIFEASREIDRLNKNQGLEKKIHIKIFPVAAEKSNHTIRYTVTKQVPDPTGKPIKDGRIITLSVSMGHKVRDMPDFIGKSLKQVRQYLYSSEINEDSKLIELKKNIRSILSNNNLNAKKQVQEMSKLMKSPDSPILSKPVLTIGSIVFRDDPDIPAGHVISQIPRPKQPLFQDTAIKLFVSKGNNKEYLTLNNYINRPAEEVLKILEDKKIITSIKNVPGQSNNDGMILSQSISQGQKLYPGDQIVLGVGHYNSSDVQGKYSLIKFIVPSSYHKRLSHNVHSVNNPKVKVKILVKDHERQTTVFEGDREAGDKIIECYKVIGKGSVEIFLDNIPFDHYSLN